MRLRCLEADGTTTVVDTDRAKKKWTNALDFNGRNWINRSTGEEFRSEVLYLSRKDRYYIVRYSRWQGEMPKARFVSKKEAAEWLALNDYDLPDDLKDIDVTE